MEAIGILILIGWLVAPIVLGVLLMMQSSELRRTRKQLESNRLYINNLLWQLSQKNKVNGEESIQDDTVTKPVVQAQNTAQPVAQEPINVQPQNVAQPVAQEPINVQPQNVAQPVAQAPINAQPQGMTQSQNMPHPQGVVQPPYNYPAYAYQQDTRRVANKEKKPISSGVMLFGIGILLVLVAGAIFATTTWNILPAFGKVTVLLFTVAVFYAGAFVSQKKLNLRNTSITLFILGSAFMAIINLAAGFFGWYGDYYCLDGDGSLMIWSISAIITAFCMISGGIIYRTKVLGLLGYYFALLSVLLGSAFAFESSISIMACIGIALIVSQLYVWLVESKNNVDVIGTSLRYMEYVYCAIVLFATIAGVIDAKNEGAFNIYVLVGTNLILMLWRAYVEFCGEEKAHKVISMIAAGIAVFAVGISMGFLEFAYQRMYVSLAIYILIYAVATFMKKGKDDVNIIIVTSSWFAQIAIMLVTITQTWQFIWNNQNTPELLLLAAGVLLYVLGHVNHDNRNAFLSTSTIFWAMIMLSTRVESVDYVVPLLLALWGIVIISVVAGRIIYGKVYSVSEKGKYIDWISICSSMLLAYACILASDDEALLFVAVLLVAVYIAGYYKRLGSVGDKLALIIAIMWAGQTIGNQPFVEINADYKVEWWIVVSIIETVAVIAVLRKYRQLVVGIIMVVAAMILTAELTNGLSYSYDVAQNQALIRLIIYLLGAIVLMLIAVLMRSKVMVIESGVALWIFTLTANVFDNQAIYILALVLALGYFVYLHLEKMSVWTIIPIAQMYTYLILREPSNIVWLAVFIVTLIVAALLNVLWNKEERDYASDILNVANIIPVIAVCCEGEDKWISCGLMMLTIYVLSFYKRYDKNGEVFINKTILTIASVVVGLGWITQPWFEVHETLQVEWVIIAVMGVCVFNMLVVYKHNTNELWGWITFAMAIFSILIQAENAISDGNVVDALILGVAMVAVLIWSYFAKRKQWFVLAAVVLVLQSLYASREFWKSIAWWIYLLVAGSALIAIAARSEYKKRMGVPERAHSEHHFMQDWTL